MPTLVVIGQQIKETRIYNNKILQPEYAKTPQNRNQFLKTGHLVSREKGINMKTG